MKILWLCNVELPRISRLRGRAVQVFGGWLSQEAELLLQEHELMVLYPDKTPEQGQEGRLSWQGFLPGDRLGMQGVLDRFQPQVIHIWGTEMKHAADLMQLAESAGFAERTVISVQGLISACALHYTEGIPESVVKRYTPWERLKRQNIAGLQQEFARRGAYEQDALGRARNVIGRTEWDRAVVAQINPRCRYFHCDETLRVPFYGPQWTTQGMERHSIFVSQCSYPLKGFHRVLEAMPLILQQYPDAVVYTTGRDLLHLSPMQRLRLPSYWLYLLELIDRYHLQDHVRFLGTLSAEEMRERYLSSNVFVNPSSIENSSNAVGEAMLLGCPVVASYVGGVTSMLTHDREGFFYQASAPYLMAHYVCRIFGDDALALRLSAAARQRAGETHRPEKNHRQMLHIYERLADGADAGETKVNGP